MPRNVAIPSSTRPRIGPSTVWTGSVGVVSLFPLLMVRLLSKRDACFSAIANRSNEAVSEPTAEAQSIQRSEEDSDLCVLCPAVRLPALPGQPLARGSRVRLWYELLARRRNSISATRRPPLDFGPTDVPLPGASRA